MMFFCPFLLHLNTESIDALRGVAKKYGSIKWSLDLHTKPPGLKLKEQDGDICVPLLQTRERTDTHD